VYMPNDPLVKVDRMSMAHSLEVRSPFLDHRVVELAFRIPSARKLRGTTGKVLLRELARQRLPTELATLPKRGFTLPIGEWIAGPYRQAFADDVLGPGARVNAILDTRRVRRLLGEFQPHMASHAYALWAVWLLEKWLRRQPAAPLTESLAAPAAVTSDSMSDHRAVAPTTAVVLATRVANNLPSCR
jgi:asparagine synthase (glutamine-hydrolysing)